MHANHNHALFSSRSSCSPSVTGPTFRSGPRCLGPACRGRRPARNVDGGLQRAAQQTQASPPASGSLRPEPSSGKNGNKTSSKSLHSFFYFDPNDPESLIEHRASGATIADAPTSSTPRASRSAAPGASAGTEIAALNSGSEDNVSATKTALVQQELVAQLELTRQKVAELQQHENASREWRVRAQRAAADIVSIQRTLADKDTELASAYKRLENAAAERAALRKQNLALDEEGRSLKAIMEEVRLLGGSSESGTLPVALSRAIDRAGEDNGNI